MIMKIFPSQKFQNRQALSSANQRKQTLSQNHSSINTLASYEQCAAQRVSFGMAKLTETGRRMLTDKEFAKQIDDLTTRDKNENTPLHLALIEGNNEKARDLMNQYKEINSPNLKKFVIYWRNHDCCTALDTALNKGNKEIATGLINLCLNNVPKFLTAQRSDFFEKIKKLDPELFDKTVERIISHPDINRDDTFSFLNLRKEVLGPEKHKYYCNVVEYGCKE